MKPFTGIRDRVVVWLANAVLECGSKSLQQTIQSLIQVGMNSAQFNRRK